MPKKQTKLNVEKILKERDEYLAGWKRALADLENYKKQFEKERIRIRLEEHITILNKFLPIESNLRRAIETIPLNQKGSAWVGGIIAINNQFYDTLKDMGIKKIETVGEKFDPNLHEAMIEEETDGEEGVILEELEPGYKMGDRIIKYPKVKVSK